MPRRKQTKGVCVFCDKEMAKGGAPKHLATCAKRQAALEKVNAPKGPTEKLYYLRVHDAAGGPFWLELEMRGASTLKDLDHYLRAIWLECCGHLSQFSFGGWGGEEVSMKRPIQAVFQPEVELTHIYDFGTESVTVIKAVSVREGKPLTKHPIFLMARNLMPEAKCMECDEPATWVCIECQIEHDAPGTLCDQHAQEHPHDNYGEPMALVNSPRVGMCGYDGPATPPY